MSRYIRIAIVLVGFLALAGGTSWADYTIWHSPISAQTNDSRLTIETGYANVDIDVYTSSPGDLQWITIPLTLPSNVEITGVTVCYEYENAANFISQIRLGTMTIPHLNLVQHDDPTDLPGPGPDCAFSAVNNLPVEGTVSLSLRLNYSTTGEWIAIGAVGIQVAPIVSGMDDGYGPNTNVTLHQNQPNPFNPNTTISYALTDDGWVDLQIVDVGGRVVRNLVSERQIHGEYHHVWDGRDDHGIDLPSGTYYYRVHVGEEVQSRGMVLLR